MFLLNSLLITEYVEKDEGLLSITDFVPKNLQHTFYYFRLGSEGLLNGEPYKLDYQKDKLTLAPNDFANIKTHEAFYLSEKFLGIFGTVTDLAKNGLQLLHSPFIDPGFKGPLKFGIKNLSNQPVTLKFEESRIGKICFFDISDTYPINVKKNSIIYRKFIDSQS